MKRRRSETFVSNWDNIPSDVAYLIFEKLPEIIERIRFSAVCKSWNSITKSYQQQPNSRHNVLPLFLVPSPNAPAKRESPRLYALSCHGKHYSNLQLPLLYSRRRYYGSCYGWIVTQNRDNTIRLTCPFGKDVRTIDLPGIRSLHRPSYCVEVKKLIISPDSTPDDYTVLAIYGGMEELAMIKSGETSWVYISSQHGGAVPASLFSDVIFYRGAFYVVSGYGQLVKIDIRARPPIPEVIIPLDLKEKKFSKKMYLVESTSSELYLIQRNYNKSYPEDMATVGFIVLKLMISDGLKSGAGQVDREVMKSINGDTFFVGDNMSLAVRSNGSCVANSIYFSDDVYDPGYYKPNGPIDVGFYNVENETLGHFYQTNPAHRENTARSIWIMPLQHF